MAAQADPQGANFDAEQSIAAIIQDFATTPISARAPTRKLTAFGAGRDGEGAFLCLEF